MFSNGVSTNRDEWVYDKDYSNLKNKINFFIEKYNFLLLANDNSFPIDIKWSHAFKNKFNSKIKIEFKEEYLTNAIYRPFNTVKYYCDLKISDLLTEFHFDIFGENLKLLNYCIVSNPNSQKPFLTYAVDRVFDLHFVGAAAGSLGISLYTYDKDDNRHDNITDWALNQFKAYYAESKIMIFDSITKETIFHYVYAVLHNRAYRKNTKLI
jgi:predicted helicase